MKFYAFLILLVLLISATAVFVSRQNKIPKNPLPQVKKTSETIPLTKISTGPVPKIAFTLKPGYTIHIFASNLPNARDLEFSPQGTLLVSNPAAGTVTALPDKNNDGEADTHKVVFNNGNHTHGIAFSGNKLYLADVNRVRSYDWNENNLSITNGKTEFLLPTNTDHNNRTLAISSGQLYVSVGSTCNVCRENPTVGGSVWTLPLGGQTPEVFSTGLRNASFLAVNPTTKAIWATEMGRDNLGNNIPPDEINILKKGGDYGWPNCYGNKIHDTQFDKSRTNPCDITEAPIFQIPAHEAPLGLVFIDSPQFSSWNGDLLVAYHGSWNRTQPAGYKVVRLKVDGNTIVDSEDFLTGFISPTAKNGNEAMGRPVDMAFDRVGNLYLSDDKAGNVYIIQHL